MLITLTNLGIYGTNLQWFYSYLCDRTQYVETGSRTSNIQRIRSGVPQGTVLGPTLFTIYIDPMLHHCEGKSEAVAECFADDSMFYSAGRTVKEAVTKLNGALKDVAEWVDKADLVLNKEKCLAMIICSQYSKKKTTEDTTAVQMGEHVLKLQHSTKYLGVHVDQHLQWDQQCQLVRKKINIGTCFINRAKGGLPKEERSSLYRAFVEPHLDYCAPVWSATTEKNIGKIETAQRNAVRALTDYTHKNSVEELFTELNIEPAR